MLKGLSSLMLLSALASSTLTSCDGPQKSPKQDPPTQPPGATAAKPEEKKVEEKKPEEKKPAEAVATKTEEKKAPENVTPPTPAPAQPSPTPPAQGATTPTPSSAAAAAPASSPNPALLNPALANEKAPEKFKVKFATTKGDFVIEVTRAWAPNGADRFYNLVKIGYLNDVAFFRNIQGFMVQFGINGDPAVNAKWRSSNIQDDPVQGSNLPGYVTFAQAQFPNSRSTQIFINFGNNSRLDAQRFAPFGQVVEGMNVVQSLYNGYGEGAPGGRGPRQDLVQSQGNAYLKQSFPLLDYVKTATIMN